MSEQDDDFEPAGGEDLQLEKALVEYANSMPEEQHEAFLQKLKDDPSYYGSMGKALAEMAMLIASAAVMDNNAEFAKTRRRILFESRQDDSEIIALRVYYLNNRHAVDMEAVIENDAAQERFEERLQLFSEDYKQQHPA